MPTADVKKLQAALPVVRNSLPPGGPECGATPGEASAITASASTISSAWRRRMSSRRSTAMRYVSSV
jgi:hypothetical protein